MTKQKRIMYWITTGWLALGMLSTGIVQLLQRKEEVALFTHLGYPPYLLPLLAICKILGVIVVLIPAFPLLKEWAYAGFFFTMSGAVLSHVMCRDAASDVFGPVLLLALTLVSWYVRPAERRLPKVVTAE